ncbi:YciI family protein [Gemmobacter sp.]|uniref:YciI family protein n=1 Tax=Gemmobacter sp. TaxID=1898957 RepID=UPI002AFE2DDC|nr:YciI family protein [Gemmobacter sp.]
MSAQAEIDDITRNFFRKTLWAIESSPVWERERITPLIAEHLRYQVALEQSGALFAAGPLFEGDGPPVCGLIILRGESEDEVRRLADADPMHSSGARRYKLRRWQVNEGRITLTLDLSRSRADLP